jgi:hypothetical protein
MPPFSTLKNKHALIPKQSCLYKMSKVVYKKILLAANRKKQKIKNIFTNPHPPAFTPLPGPYPLPAL